MIVAYTPVLAVKTNFQPSVYQTYHLYMRLPSVHLCELANCHMTLLYGLDYSKFHLHEVVQHYDFGISCSFSLKLHSEHYYITPV